MVVPMLEASINLKDLYRAIGDDGLVVEAVFTTCGLTLFGISADGIEFCQEYKQETGQEPIDNGGHEAYENYKTMKDPSSQVTDKLCSEETIMELSSQKTEMKLSSQDTGKELTDSLQAISDMLLLPLAALIRKKKHLIFALSGNLMSFPFAALPLDGKPLFCKKLLSITPSLSLLFHLSQGAA